jgi:NADPH:quinone reductase-like Zn-dependent oxidoreductase
VTVDRLLDATPTAVQGVAGGVGVYAVQLAAILGADVTATGRARQGDFVRSLGARTFTEDAGDVRGGFGLSLTRWAGRYLRRPTASPGAAAD